MEGAESLRGLAPSHSDLVDTCRGWASGLAPFQQCTELVLGPFGHNFHIAIVDVADPSGQSCPARFILRPCAEENPLDSPTDGQREAFQRWRFGRRFFAPAVGAVTIRP